MRRRRRFFLRDPPTLADSPKEKTGKSTLFDLVDLLLPFGLYPMGPDCCRRRRRRRRAILEKTSPGNILLLLLDDLISLPRPKHQITKDSSSSSLLSPIFFFTTDPAPKVFFFDTFSLGRISRPASSRERERDRANR